MFIELRILPIILLEPRSSVRRHDDLEISVSIGGRHAAAQQGTHKSIAAVRSGSAKQLGWMGAGVRSRARGTRVLTRIAFLEILVAERQRNVFFFGHRARPPCGC